MSLYNFTKPRLFTEIITAAPTRDYVFGTSGNVTNINDLATDWRALEDFTGSTTINNEFERYPTTFNTTNHVFTATSLDLTATCSSWPTTVQTTTTGVSVGAVVPVTSIAGIAVGMLVGCLNTALASTMWVVSIGASDVTLNASPGIGSGATVWFLPAYGNTATANSSGTQITFASVPAGVAAGQVYLNITGGTFGKATVVSKDATHVNLDVSVGVGTGNVIVFHPSIDSGQMWSKWSFTPPTGSRVIAGELTAKLPLTSKTGAWPAWWLYSSDDSGTPSNDELDLIEFFHSDTGANKYQAPNHGAGIGNKLHRRPGGFWDAFDFFVYSNELNQSPPVDWGGKYRKFQFIWEAGRTRRFVDGDYFKGDVFNWIATAPPQMGINLGCGSLLTTLLSTGLHPRNTATFPIVYSLKELKIWEY